MAKTLYIIDSLAHLYASFHAIGGLSSPQGEPTGAVFGFTQAVLKVLREKHPDRLVAVFDAPGKTVRHEAFAEYKATRKPMPEDLVPQIDRAKQVLAALGVPMVECPGYEADDLAARLAREAAADDCDVVIVSRDKDLMQLLGPRVVMYDTRNERTMGPEWLQHEKHLRPEQVVDWLALMGDASDNIPGVPGIGEKRAIGLLEKFGSLDELLERADEVKGKMGESLRANAEQARASRELATLQTDMALDVAYDDLVPAEADRERLVELFSELGFKSLLEEVMAGDEQGNQAARDEKQFRAVTTETALRELAEELSAADAFAFDTETLGVDPLTDAMVGMSFSMAQNTGVYVPVRGPEGTEVLPLETVRNILGPVFAGAKSTKIAHNAKFDLAVLATAGIEVRGPIFDTMIASYLLTPDRREHNLDALAREYLHYVTVPITELIGEKKRGVEQKPMDQVPLPQITFYAAEDAEVTWRLHELFRPRLEADGLLELFADVEMPLVRVLERMERTGVALDGQKLSELSERFGTRMAELEAEIHVAAGHEFNVDSPRQLEVVLFDELGLKPIRKTKTGRSTDAATLDALADKHEVPAKVLEYRMLAKLKGTYVDALPQLVNAETGRVHASFNQAVTATGRLSSSNPNLQNIPVRGELGREIRAAFVPGDRRRDVLLAADYSQIELRLLAHFCQDPFLLEAFKRDFDIHSFVASEVFSVDQADVSGEQRARAKAINFSLIYGKSAYGLSRDLGISVGEATDFIEAYFARYTRVREFMEHVLCGARDDGYVTTILGRRRPTPGVKHTDGRRWNNAERAAFNTVLQGSAADLIKVAMNNIDRRLREQDRPSRMILQVHDELVFEVPGADVEAECEMIVEEMVGAIELEVPMKVDVGTGPNWLEAK